MSASDGGKPTARVATKSAPTSGLNPSLPVLRYDTKTNSNNYFEFRRGMHAHATAHFEDLGRLFMENAIPALVRPPIPPALAGVQTRRSDMSIEHEILVADYKRDLDLFAKEKKVREKDLVKLFGCLLGQISPESISVMDEEPEWEAVETGYDPVALWKLITKTHLVRTTGVPSADRQYERTMYANMKQARDEDLGTFIERYKNQLKRLNTVGVTSMGENDLAADFIEKLNELKFTGLSETLRKNALQDIAQYPSTLKAAITLAKGWNKNYDYDLDTSTSVDEAPPAVTVFVARKDDGKSGKNNRGGAAPKNDGEKAPLTPCYLCDEEHRVRDCPYRSEFREWIKLRKEDKKDQTEKIKTANVKAAFVNYGYDTEEEDSGDDLDDMDFDAY